MVYQFQTKSNVKFVIARNYKRETEKGNTNIPNLVKESIQEYLEHIFLTGTHTTLVNITKFKVVLPEFFQVLHMSLMFCNYASGRSYKSYKNFHSKELQCQPYIRHIHSSDMPSVVGSAAASSSHQAAGKMRSERHCTSCRDHKCDRAIPCAGRGGRSLCKCTDHPITKNPCVGTT